MTWVLVIGVGWLLLAALVAVVIGRSVRLADAKAAAEASADEPNFVVDPATAPMGFPAARVLPFPAPAAEEAARRPDRSATPPRFPASLSPVRRHPEQVVLAATRTRSAGLGWPDVSLGGVRRPSPLPIWPVPSSRSIR